MLRLELGDLKELGFDLSVKRLQQHRTRLAVRGREPAGADEDPDNAPGAPASSISKQVICGSLAQR